jgi:hypothetical protein
LCFSATGSFAISGVLTGIGAASLVRSTSKPQRMFAAVPLLFAVQQAAEGIVWLTIGDPQHATLHRVAVYAFLGVALVVWPSWLPLSLRRVEQNAGRQQTLTGLAWLGILVSTYAAVLLILWQPVARIAGHSIAYDYQRRDDLAIHVVYLLGYVVPTVIPFFVSTAWLARIIGALLIASLIVTVIVQRDALASVWCFFAAMLSSLILMAVTRREPVGELNAIG